ncbi:MAG: sugar phosphorylase [Desulfobacteraceae bacterium]|jgi:sucrose phosphorylase
MVDAYDEIRSITEKIYGAGDTAAAVERLAALIDRFKQPNRAISSRFSEADAVLISYGDTLVDDGCAPLQSLCEFACGYLKESFSAIHLLPFFPYSSDDGFSVIDYKTVNPAVGTWQDIERIGREFDLMVDYVLNHVSAKSQWFRRYLADEPGYRDLAIEVPAQTDLSMVTRPRSLALLTPVTKTSGEQVQVWTTFSDDQIDLNYQSVDVLTKMVEVLLFYIDKGARLIRMDAVAYLWKQIGTRCIHLPQTHDMVRLFRKILDQVAPEVIIITETNVPHDENVSYFGDGRDEAQMVYNFSLPPLLLYAFDAGDASVLSRWAQSLSTPSEHTTFFNFTASHDGIGVRPAEGILSAEQIDRLTQLALRNGGQVSYKDNSDGSQSPYELNLTYVDAMGADPYKYLASQAIAMTLPGVPAVYIHSLVGSRNWHAGVKMTGRARSINRQQLKLPRLLKELEDSGSFRAKIFSAYCHMLKVRRSQPAFHPNAGFEVLELDHRVFGVRRRVPSQEIYAVTNVGAGAVSLSLTALGVSPQLRDLLSNRLLSTDALRLNPYQTLWLEG